MNSLTLCEPWTAHQALQVGLITDIAPALKVDGKFIPNPLVNITHYADDYGRIIFGAMKTGTDLARGKELMAKGEVDLSKLDELTNKLIAKLLYTFPNCLSKTLTEVRKKKLEHWDKNKESSREWLALNMMSEGKAGFRAFNDGPKNDREINFIKLRQLLAEGKEWNDDMHKAISPQFQNTETLH